MSHTSFKNDTVIAKDAEFKGNVKAKYIYGDISFATGGGQASIPDVVVADVQGNVVATGNVSGRYFLGNGALLTGINGLSSLPSVGQMDVRGNVIGTYANVTSVIASTGNIANVRFNNGNVVVPGQVIMSNLVVNNDVYLKGPVGINVAAPGVQFAVSGTTQITGNFSTFGNLKCSQDTNLANTFSTRLRLKNITSGGIAENIFWLEANVPGDNTFNFISASQNHRDAANAAVVFKVNGAGDITANSISVNDFNISGNLNTNAVYSSYFSGSGSGLINIPATAFTSGPLFKDIAGSIEGNFANVAEVNSVSGNIANVRFNGGNVSGGYFIGNGALLTGITGGNLPPIASVDIRGNVIGENANVIFGNIANVRFNNGNVVVPGQVIVSNLVVNNDVYLRGPVGINVAAPGVQFAVSGTTQITGNFSTFGNLRCSQDTNIGNTFATRLRLKNTTNGGIAENIFYLEANVPGSDTYNFITATNNFIDTPNVATVFRVSGRGVVASQGAEINGNILAVSGNIANVLLDNGNVRVPGMATLNSVFLTAPTSTVNMIQMGGTQATLASTNTFGFGRNSNALRLNTMTTGSFEFYAGGTPVANITNTGNLIIAGPDATKFVGTTWATGSDRRLKSNIIPANLEMCLNVVRALDLKRFEWGPQVAPYIRDTSVLGWIAQEVENVFPKSVKTASAYGLEDAKILDTDQLFINTYGALKKAVEIIDELSTKVDKLSHEVGYLSNRVSDLTLSTTI